MDRRNGRPLRQLYSRGYDATLTDPHYGATEPRQAEGCGCDSPLGLTDETGDVRCFRCGRSLAASATTRHAPAHGPGSSAIAL